MALASRHTDLFTLIGRFNADLLRLDQVQSDNLVTGEGYGVDYLLNEFESLNRNDLSVNLYQRYTSFTKSIESLESGLHTYLNNILLDLSTTYNCARSIPTILPLLYADMLAPGGGADPATVLKNTVAAGTATAGGSNTGNGTVVTSITSINGVTNENIIADSIKVVCIADKNINGGTTGADRFSINGSGSISKYSYLTKKAPLGGAVTMAESATILTNGSFETFTVTNTPDDWTIDNGTVTTNILKESTNVFISGTNALFLKSDASAATIKLHQDIAPLLGRKYAIQVQLRKTGSLGSSASRLQISVKGTGFTTVDVFALADADGLTTSYVAYSVAVDFPTIVPSDLKVEVAWTIANGVTSGQGIYVDQITMAPMIEFNHVWYAVFRGSTDFLVNDYFTLANANNYAGKFQTMFGRFYDFVLPSVASAQTVDEAWATLTYP